MSQQRNTFTYEFFILNNEECFSGTIANRQTLQLMLPSKAFSEEMRRKEERRGGGGGGGDY